MAVAIVTVTVVSAQENDKEDMMVIPLSKQTNTADMMAIL